MLIHGIRSLAAAMAAADDDAVTEQKELCRRNGLFAYSSVGCWTGQG